MGDQFLKHDLGVLDINNAQFIYQESRVSQKAESAIPNSEYRLEYPTFCWTHNDLMALVDQYLSRGRSPQPIC